jgi:D-alanine-D-alanine ligase-like ATP-grasp enzyme
VLSPPYALLDPDAPSAFPFPPPYVIKCEYTCDSVGVAVARSPGEALQIARRFSAAFGQRVFAEKWERAREFTVAFIPGHPQPLIAPLEVTLATGATIIDRHVKSDNSHLRFDLPEPVLARRIGDCVARLAEELAIDGHFRVDVLLNSTGDLHVIDVNFLPQMHLHGGAVSYFPMALKRACRLSDGDILEAMLLAPRTRRLGRFDSTRDAAAGRRGGGHLEPQ